MRVENTSENLIKCFKLKGNKIVMKTMYLKKIKVLS